MVVGSRLSGKDSKTGSLLRGNKGSEIGQRGKMNCDATSKALLIQKDALELGWLF
jgi:hypothetical protein